MTEQRQRTTITIDAQAWRRFRSLCALQGKDASAVVEELVNEYLATHEASTRAATALKESL
jgi:hypothetical protein